MHDVNLVVIASNKMLVAFCAERLLVRLFPNSVVLAFLPQIVELDNFLRCLIRQLVEKKSMKPFLPGCQLQVLTIRWIALKFLP